MVVQYPNMSLKKFDVVIDYRYLPASKVFYILTKKGNFNSLSSIDDKGVVKEFWSDTAKILSWLENVDKSSIVFMTEQKRSRKEFREVLYYTYGSNQPRKIISDDMSLVYKEFVIPRDPFAFTENGLLIYLKEKQKPVIKGNGKASGIDVWSYFDPIFQTAQKTSKDYQRKFAHTIDLTSGQITRLEYDGELININEGASTRYFILYKYKQDALLKFDPNSDETVNMDIHKTTREFNWNSALQPDVFLINSKDGSRQLLRKQVRPYAGDLPSFYLSPNGKYVIQFNGEDRHYYSFEISSGKWRKITADIKAPLEKGNVIDNHMVAHYYKPAGLPTWENSADNILIPDTYSDIWRVSLDGQKPPINITGGFAKQNKVLLRFVSNTSVLNQSSLVYLELSWKNTDRPNRHKNGGLYELNLSNRSLRTLIKEKGDAQISILASSGNSVLLKREYTDKPEDFVFTNDFRDFREVNSSLPEERTKRAVNKEFISWKTFDGLDCYGMLTKPRDFDPNKKYPVIVKYYELARFDTKFEWEPKDGQYKEFDEYLNKGYLVFQPEIYQDKIGQPCLNAYNCVVSGTKQLLKRSYIDAKRIGIIGSSMGGFETNCLITQTNIFAAAVSNSGMSDMISNYLGDIPGSEHTKSQTPTIEVGQPRLGTTMWKNLDVYIANSPVLHADKVTTPLLLVHSKDDYNVPYLQSVEMFKALRRTGKKVWLITGPTGGHGGPRGSAYFTMQFFDHYLKESAPGKWMTQGLPQRLKGIMDPLELDMEISEPPPPIVYEKEAVIPIQVKDKPRKQK